MECDSCQSSLSSWSSSFSNNDMAIRMQSSLALLLCYEETVCANVKDHILAVYDGLVIKGICP